MKKVSIFNNKDGRQFQATMDDPTDWISDCIEKTMWGLPEREVKRSEATEWDEAHAKQILAKEELSIDPLTNTETVITVEYLLVEAEYSITIEDLTDTAEDPRWVEMREKRDRLIAETDFTQLADCPLSDSKKSEFKTYRQALRELPNTITDITNFEFPVKTGIKTSGVLLQWGEFKEDSLPLIELGKNNLDAVKIFDIVGWN